MDISYRLRRQAIRAEPRVDIIEIDGPNAIDRTRSKPRSEVPVVYPPVVVERLGCEIGADVVEPPVDDIAQSGTASCFDATLADVEHELGSDALGVGLRTVHRAHDSPPRTRERIGG